MVERSNASVRFAHDAGGPSSKPAVSILLSANRVFNTATSRAPEGKRRIRHLSRLTRRGEKGREDAWKRCERARTKDGNEDDRQD